MSGLTESEREELADACDVAYDFGPAWIRFLRNGNEEILLPVVEAIVARRVRAALTEAADHFAAESKSLRASYREHNADRDLSRQQPRRPDLATWADAYEAASNRIVRALISSQ